MVDSENMFEKRKFVITTAVSIVSLLLGTLVGSYIDIWTIKSNQEYSKNIEDLRFEYSIIENALNLNNADERIKSLDFALKVGLFSEIDTTALKQAISTQQLPNLSRRNEGYIDAITLVDMLFIIEDFYKKNQRVPYRMAEIENAYRLDLHYKILGKFNIKYQAIAEKEFRLHFAHSDDILGNQNDIIYEFEDLPMNKN